MLVKIIRDMKITDQKGNEIKLKKGRIVTAELDNTSAKCQYKLLLKENELIFPEKMKDVVFEVLE